jgi:hypothetical protein
VALARHVQTTSMASHAVLALAATLLAPTVAAQTDANEPPPPSMECELNGLHTAGACDC